MRITITQDDQVLIDMQIEAHERKVLDWDCFDFVEWVRNAIAEKIRRTTDAYVEKASLEIPEQVLDQHLQGFSPSMLSRPKKFWSEEMKKKVVEQGALETAKQRQQKIEAETLALSAATSSSDGVGANEVKGGV